MQHEAKRSTKHFILLVKKVQTRALPKIHLVVLRDGSLEVVGRVIFVLIQSIWVVNLLIVDLHFILCKMLFTWVTVKTGVPPQFLHQFWTLLWALFYFFAIVSYATTTLDKFQFQYQVRLSQFNVLVSIRLKFKFYAIFIESGSGIYFLFAVRQDIVNYWEFLRKVSRNWHKSLVLETTGHDQWEMFKEMSLRDRLVCFAD